METYTWNVIFMSMDVSYQDNANSRLFSKVIQLGANFFIKDVENTDYSDQLKITFFNFKSDSQKGTAEVLKNISTNPSNKNALTNAYSIEEFDCLNSASYDLFFDEEITKPSELENQKFIIIFLAHSFGAGFFFKQKETELNSVIANCNKQKNVPKEATDFEYFTTVQLNTSLKKAIGIDKKIDCFIGLNCWLQSIETNVVFKDTTNYLISSQQPLETTELSYIKFFKDLVYTAELPSGAKVPLSEEIIFSKFLYNCYQVYKKRLDEEERPIYKLDNFGLSLTRPPLAEKYRKALHKFWQEMYVDTEAFEKLLGERNVDYWSYAAHFCADPSFIQSINIIDATQFFLKLKTFYAEGSRIGNAIETTLDALRGVVILNVSSPFMCSTDLDALNLLTTYVPYGVGIFTPKLLSTNLYEILKIYAQKGKNGKSITPEPTKDFFENMLNCIADFHNGDISLESRNTTLQKKLFKKKK